MAHIMTEQHIIIFAIYAVVMTVLQFFLLNVKKGKKIKKVFLFIKTYAVLFISVALFLYFIVVELTVDTFSFPEEENIYIVLFLFTYIILDLALLAFWLKGDFLLKKNNTG